jgi:hypothetical protein
MESSGVEQDLGTVRKGERAVAQILAFLILVDNVIIIS